MPHKKLLNMLMAGNDFARDEMTLCMNNIMDGAFSDIVLAALLALLQKKGITPDEAAGACASIMAKATLCRLDDDAVDTCGTGGDHAGTFNISTAAAFIACGAGINIAKHGNRSITSRCGSADVLEALGFTIDLPPEATEELFRQTGFAFLFAPLYHPSMKAVAHVRKELGIKTIFNILGPLLNPAGVKRQLVGVFEPALMELYGSVLQATGCRHTLIVHGETETGAAFDEPSLSGPTYILELNDGVKARHTVYPEDFGFNRWPVKDLSGGNREENAVIIRNILDGSATKAKIEAALYAAAMTCYVSGKASCIDEGVCMVNDSLESGQAACKFAAILQLNGELSRKHKIQIN
ncbi:MAG: anthranilate phosphoribosyltransferase [Chlorobiaceae bacterium]|jgi:anthranilate phosphoribosyltransferase|nr:anthranilate phosphoribosyltransferase [Chlorobiaceae bacterium]